MNARIFRIVRCGRRWWRGSPASHSGSVSTRSEEHTSELQSRLHLVCRLLLEKKKNIHCVARQQHAKIANERRCPFFLAHLAAAVIEPHHIAAFSTSNPQALEELRTAYDIMIL